MPRIYVLLSLCLPAVLSCGSEDGGDDLPPGAFTSGPDDDGNVDVGDPTTSGGSSTGSSTPEGSSTTTGSADTSGSGSGSDTEVPLLSHDADILPIWLASCTDSSCHDADAPQSGLDLETDGVYDRICGGFHGFSGMSYIDCDGADPEVSYIWRKIEGSHLDGDISGASGVPMPPVADDLSASDRAIIESWIMGGALP